MESKRNKIKTEVFYDPIIRSIGILSSYSTIVGIEEELLCIHVTASVGSDDCQCLDDLVIKAIGELLVKNTCLKLIDGLIHITENGIEKSRSVAGKNFSGLTVCGYKDHRDEATWVVVELSPLGETRLEEGTIELIIRRNMGLDKTHPMFVPRVTYSGDEESVSLHLLDGYIFIMSGLPEVAYFRLERTPYVSRVLSEMGSNGIRVLSVVPNHSVEEMRDQMSCLSVSDLRRGDVVVVVDGMYRGLDVTIMEVCSDRAIVKTHGLRSISIITSIPINHLSNVR